MLILDTSMLLAAYNARDRNHGTARAFLEQNRRTLLVSPFVIAELDYMLTQRAGIVITRRFFDDLLTGPFAIATFDAGDLQAALSVIDRYTDQSIGITDASLVVLADRYKTLDILTLDFRHFDVLRPLRGSGRFRLMPRDWEEAPDA